MRKDGDLLVMDAGEFVSVRMDLTDDSKTLKGIYYYVPFDALDAPFWAAQKDDDINGVTGDFTLSALIDGMIESYMVGDGEIDGEAGATLARALRAEADRLDAIPRYVPRETIVCADGIGLAPSGATDPS